MKRETFANSMAGRARRIQRRQRLKAKSMAIDTSVMSNGAVAARTAKRDKVKN